MLLTSSVPEGVGVRVAREIAGLSPLLFRAMEDARVAWTEAGGRNGEVRTVEAAVATRAETDGLGLRVIRPSGPAANASSIRPSRKGPLEHKQEET